MSLLILNHAAVAAALPLADCIEAVEQALTAHAQGQYQQFPRFALRAEHSPALMGLMPVFQAGTPNAPGSPGLWALKNVLVSHANRARGLDSHQGAVLLHDGETGALRALLDATELTVLRTAAASAVATRALAPPQVARIAILGTGRQALSHAQALRLLYPDAAFSIWGRDAAQARRLATFMGAKACGQAHAAVADADVVCTVTAAQTPVLEQAWLKPGCHVNAVGASTPTARELDTALVAAAEFFVDSREQALAECGEYLIPLAEGRIGADHIRGELGQVLAGQRPGRSGAQALTVFKSLGIAVEDLAAAVCALHNAERLGLGQRVAWA